MRDEYFSTVSLSGHVAAAILAPDCMNAIRAKIMRATRSRSGLWAVGAGSALVLLLLSAPAARRFGPAYVFDASVHGLRATKAAILEGYRVAPALMLGLGLAIGFPLLTVAFRLIREIQRPTDATRLYRPGRYDGEAEAVLDDEPVPHAHQPFVEVASRGRGVRYAISGDMLRIGREDDNDIRIASKAVHRYHAAIYREDYNDWHITDLSGVESNGLIVNGRRCCKARLNDGDLIELGPGRLRFRSGST